MKKNLKCALESFWNSTQKTSVSPWSKKKVLYFGKNARRPYKVLGPNNMVKVRSVRLFKKKSSHPEGFSIWQVPWPRTWRKKTSLEAPGTHSSRRVLVLWVLGPYNMAKVRSVSLFKKRTLPTRKGFLFGRFPDQEPGGREPPSKHPVHILRGGSSSSGILVKEPTK